MTGAEKLILGMLGGPWKLAGSPLGRLPCAMLACCTPGGGAVPGADMPGGGPASIRSSWGERRARAYPFPGEAPYQAAYRSGLGRLRMQEAARTAMLFMLAS